MYKSQRESDADKGNKLSLKELQKSFLKNLKKYLTNATSCDKMSKHLRETSESELIERANRTLKIKQRRDKKRNPIRFKRVLSVLVS